VTLSLLAHAYLAVVRLELIPPTFAEVRRLILAIAGPKKSGGFDWDGRCGAGPIRRLPSVATAPSATFFGRDRTVVPCNPSPQQQ
jgi:hypothetical protein